MLEKLKKHPTTLAITMALAAPYAHPVEAAPDINTSSSRLLPLVNNTAAEADVTIIADADDRGQTLYEADDPFLLADPEVASDTFLALECYGGAKVKIKAKPPKGGEIYGGGLNCGKDGSGAYGQVCTTVVCKDLAYVELTATPAEGYTFAGWKKGCRKAGTDPNCTLKLNNKKKKVGAKFVPM